RPKNLLARFCGTRIPAAPRGRAEQRARLAPGRQLADGRLERLERQHPPLGHRKIVPHQPGESRRFATDSARIVATFLRERFERDKPFHAEEVLAGATYGRGKYHAGLEEMRAEPQRRVEDTVVL